MNVMNRPSIPSPVSAKVNMAPGKKTAADAIHATITAAV